MNWINAAERMPVRYWSVLILHLPSKTIFTGFYVVETIQDEVEHLWELPANFCYILLQDTYWIPIPALPEKDGK